MFRQQSRSVRQHSPVASTLGLRRAFALTFPLLLAALFAAGSLPASAQVSSYGDKQMGERGRDQAPPRC